jgi:hypothetical protein
MARRSQQSFQKRARERARQDKQAEKRAKRLDSQPEEDSSLTKTEEDSLMQEFARLSAQYEASQISTEQYNEQRQRIFSELGIEAEE